MDLERAAQTLTNATNELNVMVHACNHVRDVAIESNVYEVVEIMEDAIANCTKFHTKLTMNYKALVEQHQQRERARQYWNSMIGSS